VREVIVARHAGMRALCLVALEGAEDTLLGLVRSVLTRLAAAGR